MITFNDEIKDIESFIKKHRLDIDIYKETIENQKIIRFYVTSKVLGGLLISSSEPGIYNPCFPEKPNYPIKGKWYSPGHEKDIYPTWKAALKAALCPEKYFKSKVLTFKKLAIERSVKLRDKLRVSVMLSLLN